MPLRERVALVTGGGSGIGAAVCALLAQRGARVAVVDRAPLEGDWPLTFQHDVRDLAQAQQAVLTTVERLGGLHLLVTCAGLTRDGRLWELSEEDWDAVMDVNLKGSWAYLRAAAPVMRSQQDGRVVLISSINGLRGKAGQANYAASKAGCIALAKTAARELGSRNVNVNVVVPGMIETPMTDRLPPEIRRRALEETVLKRLGQPQDVAETVAFLLSPAARHITGAVVPVDGGQYI